VSILCAVLSKDRTLLLLVAIMIQHMVISLRNLFDEGLHLKDGFPPFLDLSFWISLDSKSSGTKMNLFIAKGKCPRIEFPLNCCTRFRGYYIRRVIFNQLFNQLNPKI
jgi:hypothetical protein